MKCTRKYQRGRHPNSRRNLRPAQPGEVLNPKGNNQHTSRIAFETRIQDILDQEKEGADGKTRREFLAEKLVTLAENGEPWAMQLVMKRLWPERMELELPVPSYEPDLDLSRLSQEELDLLEELAERVRQ